MRVHWWVLSLLPGLAGADDPSTFQREILPVLDRVCFDCHEPGLSKGDVPFLEVETVEGIGTMRSVWRSVAAQLRNRTMPPPDKPQPKEEERARIAEWIDAYLKESAFEMDPFTGVVTARRLNRLEYDRTIRDLFGVDLKFSESLPVEGGAGEGFDNNGESLFLQPMLLERYLEAGQMVVDAAIRSPRLDLERKPADFLPAPTGATGPSRRLSGENRLTALVPIYVQDDYRVWVEGRTPAAESTEVELRVDGLVAHRFRPVGGEQGTFRQKLDLKLGRGVHALELRLGKNAEEERGWMEVDRLTIRQFELDAPDDGERERHLRLTGVKPGEKPENAREQIRRQLRFLMPMAFRRPVTEGEIGKFAMLGERALERGDPFEEALKLAYRGVLVSPHFLFRTEQVPEGGGLQPLGDFELATRLSYFLGSTMPDQRLHELAERGELNKEETLRAEVERLLQGERVEVLAESFVGQWLGTKDVGGRVAPTSNDVQEFYTPEIASDMRREAVRYFVHLIREDRSLLELIDSDYTFLTGRLAKFYELPMAGGLPKEQFRRVTLKDGRRGGVLGMGAVLALTSHHKKTSPVLRGAWVFDTLLGSPVPPPPPDVPALASDPKGKKKRTDREKLALHRDHASCQACHQLIDPIGFGLQNFDWVGRWRDQEHGQLVDAGGELPSGERFSGPEELKKVLVEAKRDLLVRNLTRKMLGYALGRSLHDEDDGTIERLAQNLEREGLGVRTLLREIVLSVPFRFVQAEDNAAKG